MKLSSVLPLVCIREFAGTTATQSVFLDMVNE
jgi:hypothetical protein